MEQIAINSPTRQTDIYIGEEILDMLAAEKLKGRRAFVLTDVNENKLYGKRVADLFGCQPYVIPSGEKQKSFDNVIKILSAMAQSSLDRNSVFVAFGGGVVGDLGGLCAALYMRGISLIIIPTTLISQADSSIGGKTAVNLNDYKNLAGSFYAPETVIIDISFLKTINEETLRSGIGEIIKMSALDKQLFEKMMANIEFPYSMEFLRKMIPLVAKFKASIVKRDEFDRIGVRKCLNVGHTTAHALELTEGKLTHGEYVLIGMQLETLYAYKKKLISLADLNDVSKLIKRVIPKPYKVKNAVKVCNKALLDKKNTDGKISVVVLTGIGSYTELKLDQKQYLDLLEGR